MADLIPRLLLGILCFSLSAAHSTAAEEPTPTLPDDPRDFSGVWMNDNSLDERLKRAGLKRLDPDSEEASPSDNQNLEILTDEYRQIYEEQQAERAQMAVGAQACGWPGMPRIMTYPYPFEILHTPGRITIIYEAESQVRRIFLDRSEHLPHEQLDPSYNGDSIGRWEGNTLVVETTGFNTRTKVGRDLPHSEEMHITERWRYVDEDTVHVDMTIADPKAFKEPLVQKLVYSRRPDWRIREYYCEENNRDAPDEEGNRQEGVVD